MGFKDLRKAEKKAFRLWDRIKFWIELIRRCRKKFVQEYISAKLEVELERAKGKL